MIIDWTNTEVTGISGIRIEMPNEAKIWIFTDNDLTHITDNHFEIVKVWMWVTLGSPSVVA